MRKVPVRARKVTVLPAKVADLRARSRVLRARSRFEPWTVSEPSTPLLFDPPVAGVGRLLAVLAAPRLGLVGQLGLARGPRGGVLDQRVAADQDELRDRRAGRQQVLAHGPGPG